MVLQVQVLLGAFALGFTKAQCERVLHSLPIQKKRRLIPVSPQKQQAMIVCPKPTFGGHPVLTLAATAVVFAVKVFFDKKQKQRAKAK